MQRLRRSLDMVRYLKLSTLMSKGSCLHKHIVNNNSCLKVIYMNIEISFVLRFRWLKGL